MKIHRTVARFLRPFLGLWTFASLAASAQAQYPARAIDTTFAVPADGRVNVRNQRGRIVVRVWDRPAIRVRVALPPSDRLILEPHGAVMEVQRVVERRRDGELATPADLELWIPRMAALDIRGAAVDVDVSGSRSMLRVNTALGDVTVANTSGPLTIDTSAGTIEVRGVVGSMKLGTSAGSVAVTASTGDLMVETTAGDVVLSEIRATRVSVRTNQGSITVRGPVASDAAYDLSSHSGLILFHLPPSADVTIDARTLAGEFSSRLVGRRTVRDDGVELVLGKGTATIRASTFRGAIRFDSIAGPR